MLNFDSNFLFSSAISHPFAENDDVLGDMIRVKTIVRGPANKAQALKILDFFGLPDSISHKEHAMESFWEIIQAIKTQVFSQLSQHKHREWRVDWSRKDHAFCLWYRNTQKSIDQTRDIDFVRKTTLNNIEHTEIRDSGVHGFGLFATKDFEKGSLLTKLDGQLMTKEIYERQKDFFSLRLNNLSNHFFMEWNVIGKTGLLLARSMRTKYSYINHHYKNPNVILEPEKHLIRLVVSQNILKGEELFLDYRREALPRSYFHLRNASYLSDVNIEAF
ncbi:MAG: SET domain-containing protein [Acidithiobacillus sp.]|nr:SET domain-containing protein [Acidithiobacillus sp.]